MTEYRSQLARYGRLETDAFFAMLSCPAPSIYRHAKDVLTGLMFGVSGLVRSVIFAAARG